MSYTVTDQPLAAKGLTSYRCRNRYGWTMIGAKDVDDAMREARRSADEALASAINLPIAAEA